MPNHETATETTSEPCARACLACGRSFPSEGIHQRICRACKRTRSPDEADPDERLDSEASRARRERGLRRLMGLPARRRGIARFLAGLGHRFETCQWIEGDPTADESCKCGRPASPGSVYCERHEKRTRRPPRTGQPHTGHPHTGQPHTGQPGEERRREHGRAA